MFHDCPHEVRRVAWAFVSNRVNKAYGFDLPGALPGAYHEGAFEALGGRIAEDMAIVCAEGGREWAGMIDVRLPSGWNPAEKIGRSFAEIHAPVPGMAAINRAGPSVVNMMIEKKPMERYVWGVQFDDQFDKHPQRARHAVFDPDRPRLFVRHERQIIVGFPSVRAALFIIRLSLHEVSTLRAAQRVGLAAALRSMTPEQRKYKGVADAFDAIIRYLGT